MGKGARYSLALNENPSPDFYNLPSQFDPMQQKSCVIFGPVPIKSIKKPSVLPGPGAYNINRSFISQNKGVKIKSRKVILNKNAENPGPNSYNISEKIVKQNRYKEITMGRGSRHSFFNKSKI